MIVDVIMPKMGESITDGTILEWRKKVGEFVEKDELFLEIGTDKVDSEIPSIESGILIEICADINEVVDVGKVIARIETDVDAVGKVDISSEKKEKEETINPVDEPETISNIIATKPKIEKPSGEIFITPVVMKIAQKNNISMDILNNLPGSGRGGRVTKKDILSYIENKPTEEMPEPISPFGQPIMPELERKTEEMGHMRKLIAEHMRRSLDTSAHVYVASEVDMSPIMEFIKVSGDQFHQKEGYKLTVTPFIMMACVHAFKTSPEMNASLDGDKIIYHKHLNIGMAVAVENGLMVPTLSKCEEMNFLGLCRKVNDIAQRTRTKHILPDELQGSTFSITNFGVFNVTMGLPIINQPNVGILGVGTIRKRPVVIESELGDSIGIKSIMMLSLGFDHRLVDGAGGSKFIDRVRIELESFNLENLF
ncbi:MAG: 2-oxo acid dehydrogenase subunit E2 [Candidatus Marinimicrobia bacterium]|nr:2-oxo acid dehydrogenase subunit E2 [Candidatus Neomarinimicrobiota bacterium]